MRVTKAKDIIRCGDCADVLRQEVADDSVDLIVTSPPYADSRKSTYGGISPDEYVGWFLPKAEEFKRVLKPTGTFILNIKEKAVSGERHTYVLDLIIRMREMGWLWTEEFMWHKRNCVPGKWPNRFRDAWERLLQFNKSKNFNMYQEAVMVPMGGWAQHRLDGLTERDQRRASSATGNGFALRVANWKDRDEVYPTNVLHMATECGNRGHSAVFPRSLPEWFIKLFTKPGDFVLDPFAGSGTAVDVAITLGRYALGIDIKPEYCEQANMLLKGVHLR